MECLIKIGTSVAAKIAEYTVAPVARHLGYIFLYGRNVENLKAETERMNLMKRTMEVSVGAAKDSGDEIHDEIEKCLTEVGKIIEDAQNLIDIIDKRSLSGSFSYLAKRYRLSKRAKEIRESIVEIKGKMRFDNISYRPKLQSNFENKDYLNSATREKFVDEIMKVLRDGSIRMIGIHGMPGAGKTTLVKEIARKALSKDRRLFDNAVIITVSQTPNLENIQQQIAERLDLVLKKKIVSERALELQNRLKDEKKFLIILDDLWNKLELEDVGIVFEGDQKGCKILMTSRFERVLGIDMNVNPNFVLKLLSEEEALNWLIVIAGSTLETRDHQELGTKIVNKCGCLPLAIVTVANSLKNCKLPIWRDAWTRLENSERDKTVSSSIKLCYDILESDETKKLVSLCSLHEEDANIEMEYLMRYCWGMSMFKGNITLQNARDRVHGWVNTLKDRCLLLDGDDSDTVKMHDVVRDIIASVAKESHHMHCFRDGGELEDFLKEKKFEDLKAISLPNGYLDELLFERSEYTQLQLMICMWSRSSKIIPGDFLDRIKLLRVLEFSDQIYFDYPKVLASHLSSLQNLRTLCLRKSDVYNIAEIGKLKHLEILDLSRSKIQKLPIEIGRLSHLRMLDLSGCEYLAVIEPNVIQHLKRLEELYVGEFWNWHKVDQIDSNGERSNANLDELKQLNHLTALHLTVPDIAMEPEVLLGQKLERYHITIGYHENFDLAQNSGSRYFLVQHEESSLLREHGIERLMKRSEELWLVGLNGVNNIVNELDTEGFPELKSLRIERNNTIQYLVNYSMGQIHPCTAFCSLEKLFLCGLSNLKQICHGEHSVELFKTLRFVTVRDCDRLKKLLPLFNARQIEDIEIRDCFAMEEIFTHQIQDDGDDNYQVIDEFLQLRSLKLKNVSKLREICSLKKIGSTSQKEEEPFVGDSDSMPLFNRKFLCFPELDKLVLYGCHAAKKLWDDQLVPSSTSFCFLTQLVVDDCKRLKYVFSSSIAASFKQLYSLDVRGCEAMEEIVSWDERMDKISFPKLYSLTLNNLPKLSTFSSGIFIEFPLLNGLHIRNCRELKSFVSESSETTMPSLFNENQFLCFPELDKLVLSGCHAAKKLWDDQLVPSSTSFCFLTKLVVYNCKSLKYVFSSSIAASFKQLYCLVVKGCETMEEIVSRDERMNSISFPKLYSLRLHNLPKLSTFSSGIFIEFSLLNDLSVWDCPELKTFVYESSEDMSNTTIPPFFNKNVAFPSLKSLSISQMDMLKMIWQHELCNINADSFCKLEEVVVQYCKNLMGIFTSGMHTRLRYLRSLEIRDCQMVEEIFVMETSNCTGIEEDVGKQERLEAVLPRDHDDEFEFPQLQEMDLTNLPNLVSIYAGTHTLRFPFLKKLRVINCLKVKALHPVTALQELFTEKDLPPSNVSAE